MDYAGLPSLDPAKSGEFPGSGFFAVFEHSMEYLGRGTLVQFDRLGFKQPTADEARDPGWGIGPESRELDHGDQYAQPYAAAESIRRIDVQRCVPVAASLIVPAGVAFELVHFRSPSGSITVIEDIPTIFDEVTALDDAGVEYFAFGSVNGERLCRRELVHPDPAVTLPLTWRFFLTYTDDPSRQQATTGPELAYQGPIPPAEVRGHHITPPWADQRYGNLNRWAENQQFFSPSSTVVRYWVALSGPVDRFRVTVGARLGGFWQLGGRNRAALDATLVRRV